MLVHSIRIALILRHIFIRVARSVSEIAPRMELPVLGIPGHRLVLATLSLWRMTSRNFNGKGPGRILVTATLVAGSLVVGCSGGGDGGEPTPTPTPTLPMVTGTTEPPTAVVTPSLTPPVDFPGFHPVETVSGIPTIDAIIVAAVDGRASDLAALTRFSRVACATQPIGVGSPPRCQAGESDGQPIEVLPATACEGLFIRPGDLIGQYQGMLQPPKRLYAVFAAESQDVVSVTPEPAYGIVLGRELSDIESPRLFIDGSGKIVQVDLGCGPPGSGVPSGRQLIVAPPA